MNKLKIVGFTGTRHGMTIKQTNQLREALKRILIVGVNGFSHGDCVGADKQANDIAIELGYPLIRVRPPQNDKYRAFCNGPNHEIFPVRPYIVRNHDIVNESFVLIAAPKTEAEQLRSGTWATIRYARKTGLRVLILKPH